MPSRCCLRMDSSQAEFANLQADHTMERRDAMPPSTVTIVPDV